VEGLLGERTLLLMGVIWVCSEFSFSFSFLCIILFGVGNEKGGLVVWVGILRELVGILL